MGSIDVMPYDGRAEHLLVYFSLDVLAAYQTQPDKYEVRTDYFEGEVRTAGPYFEELDAAERTSESISVRFGFRTKADGDLTVVVWAPDLVDKSPAHINRWRGFAIDKATAVWMEYEADLRFSMWIERYIEGSWDVENGPGAAIGERIALVNGLTLEAAAVRLFDVDEEHVRIVYPLAENSHRYADAHRELYGLLVDSIDKNAVEAIGRKLGVAVNCGSDRTLQCLRKVLPQLAESTFATPFAVVSEQRRLASHRVRPPAERTQAFATFSADLQSVIGALDLLLRTLEGAFDLDARYSRRRQDAIRHMRDIAEPNLPGNYSIHGATAMAGKTVERVEIGEGRRHPNAHGSEVIRIHFTDGSIVALDTGSNAWNLSVVDNATFEPQDFHVDFIVHWVPPRRRKSEPSDPADD